MFCACGDGEFARGLKLHVLSAVNVWEGGDSQKGSKKFWSPEVSVKSSCDVPFIWKSRMDYSSFNIGSVELNGPDVERKGGIDIKVQGRELEPDFDIVAVESPSRSSIACLISRIRR